ncbi:hypothetical protein CQW23_28912 [Capsicum baccatum]|uniref:Serine-threonine/tyrosine-protein kinase catalytic domain-containing protein n=1 Tax=Capsicum baccatum TaxID=33114 RepID=A0A2G2VHV7_CAPBA|nr:hypothetical protein CQW23_28912 [Capsicum baccatum]
MHPPPAFGLSPSTELALGTNKLYVQDGNSALTSLLLEMGLNIEEAHAFFTKDGYSLDVFVVDGWEMRFKGSFHNQEVAIKVLKVECLNEDVQRDFAQEIYILRKVRHKNVVQFSGGIPYNSTIPWDIWNLPLTWQPSPQPKFATRVGVSISNTLKGTRPVYGPSWGHNKPISEKHGFGLGVI